MARKLFWLAAVAAALLFWRFGYQASLRYFFRISGTVSLAPATLPPLPANTMLFVVARNTSGVPVAIMKVINPRFPYPFEIASSGLVMPDLLTRKVRLEAHLNTHGRLGEPARGDLRGELGEPVPIRSRHANIRLYTFRP